jgi:hypothetical protein
MLRWPSGFLDDVHRLSVDECVATLDCRPQLFCRVRVPVVIVVGLAPYALAGGLLVPIEGGTDRHPGVAGCRRHEEAAERGLPQDHSVGHAVEPDTAAHAQLVGTGQVVEFAAQVQHRSLEFSLDLGGHVPADGIEVGRLGGARRHLGDPLRVDEKPVRGVFDDRVREPGRVAVGRPSHRLTRVHHVPEDVFGSHRVHVPQARKPQKRVAG